LYRRSREERIARLGDGHVDTARCRWGEGLVLADMGRRNDALVLLQSAYRVMQRTHGEAHRDTREIQQLVEELGAGKEARS
jgi:hypothetical protein